MTNDKWGRIFNDAVVTCLKVLSRISHGDLEESRGNLRVAGDLIVTGTEHILNRNVEYSDTSANEDNSFRNHIR